MGFWNCQSAVNKVDLIPAIASQTALNILGLTETWIRPEDSATPVTLSNNFSFSHTLHQARESGGIGLLISNYWKYSTYTPLCNNHSLESHAIIVTAPVKLHVVVIYRPPGQLGTFLEELADLLSSFPEDVSSLLLASTCCPFKLLAIRCSSWVSVRTQGSREKMAQIKRSVRPEYLSVFAFIFLWWSPHWHTRQYFIHNKINTTSDTRNLFKTFNSPLSPSTTTSLTADDFVTFFTNKTRSISSQFPASHTQDIKPTTSTAKTHLFAFWPLMEAELSKLLLSSHPTTCPRPNPLAPFPSNLSHTLTSTHTHHQHISPNCIQAGSGNPTAKKQTNTFNISLTDSYRPVSLLPFIAKTLFSTSYLHFCQSITYWTLTNQGSDVDIQLRRRDSQSLKPCWFQIISSHSVGSICCFWHCQSSDPPVHPLITGHHRDSTLLVWILSHWQVFQGGLGRGGIQRTSIGHWGFPGLGSWIPPLLHIHYITGSHTSTWYLLPLLCWWHTALSLISTRWSNGSCTDLRLPGGHLGMDERTSPTAQPGKDWASCLPEVPGHSNSTTWFHHPARFFYNYPIKFSQKSWCHFWWPADFQRPHCKNCSFLQVCICTKSERSGPSLHSMQHNFLSRSLSFLDWTTAMLF